MVPVPSDFPPSRPGITTLLVGITVVVLFFIVKFWTELKAVVGA